MPYASPTFPYVLGVRFNAEDHAKLCTLAQALGQKRCQVLRYLVRQAVSAEARVVFRDGTLVAPGGGGSDEQEE